MPRVYGITIPAGLEIIYNRTLKMYDISVFCNVGKNRRFLTRRQKYNLRDFSKLIAIARVWSDLTQEQKDVWYSAGDASGINGYALWTQDKIYRLMNSLVGNATPSIYHQYKVGHIEVGSPANSVRLSEVHITPLALPVTVKISYKTNLSADGGNPYAKLILKSLRFFSGRNIEETEEIIFDLVGGWKTEEIEITSKEGILGGWSAILELNDVTGDLYFDNLNIEFSGTIQNEDPFCDSFPKYWAQDDVGGGVTVESIYCPDSVT